MVLGLVIFAHFEKLILHFVQWCIFFGFIVSGHLRRLKKRQKVIHFSSNGHAPTKPKHVRMANWALAQIMKIMMFCYLPQGYPRESYAKFPALENIPSIFQCRSSIHTHCKDLYNRTPAQNSFHQTISDLTQNNEEEKKTTKISINNNGNEWTAQKREEF